VNLARRRVATTVPWSNKVASVHAAIAVLTWRGEAATRSCLDGLQRLRGWPIPTLIVDNASGTGEGTRLAAESGPSIESLTLVENGGVPAGYNAAIHWAMKRGVTHVLLLNNDVVITEADLLERLLEAAADDVAAVGPIVCDADGSIFSAGGVFDWTRGRSAHLRRPVRPDMAYDVDWLDGPCLLVSIAAALRVGGLAPEYFMYWEELDWCVRARTLGFHCLVQPRTSIVHLRGTRNPSMNVRYLMLRNGILFMRRNGSLRQNLTSLGWAVGYKSVGMIVKRIRTPQNVPRAVVAVVRAFAWNLRDALRQGRWRVPAEGPALSMGNVDEAGES
jgi:GT2 family glycosyltransferase